MKQDSKMLTSERVKTGGIRLKKLLDSGKVPFKNGIYLDTYNCKCSSIAGTILTGIDFRNMYYVTKVCETK